MEKTAITLHQALDIQAQKAPKRPFIFHKNESYSYRQTADLVDRFCTFLKANGVGPGDKICMLLPRTPELVITFLAASRIGAWPAPINFLQPPQTVSEYIKDITPKVTIISSHLFSRYQAPPVSANNDSICIDIDNGGAGWTDWQEVLQTDPRQTDDIVSVNDVAYLNFTTGSSGKPKGALTSHGNIYWNTRSLVELFGMDENDIHLCMFASFAHPHEIFVRPLYTGGSVVLLQEINPRTVIKTINEHAVTCIMGLAPMYEAMVNHCSHMEIPSLRIVESGGMYTRPKINERFMNTFGRPIFSVWGSTEATGVALANTPEEHRIDGSMGKACPYYELKLISNGREVPEGEIGEMYIRGPGITEGYENYSNLLDEQGWYASGDLAKQDGDGYYYFIERKSGMIKYAGLKVYPLQVENILLLHPDIAEAAIIGIEDLRKGMVPKAFIVTKPNKAVGKNEIWEFCKDKLPAYMIPKDITTVESLPKIGSGKINKKAILETLATN